MGTSHSVPARPDLTVSSEQVGRPAPTAGSSKRAKVAGLIMMVLGGLLTLGGFSNLTNRKYASEKPAYYLMIFLSVATVAGGFYLYKKGWQQGHDIKNVLSVLPGAVLVVLIAFGAIASAVHHTPPTDAYGYTTGERQLMVSGCGGGARCECAFSAMERNIPHDQFVAEVQRYDQTGSFSPEFVRKLTDIEQSSGC